MQVWQWLRMRDEESLLRLSATAATLKPWSKDDKAAIPAQRARSLIRDSLHHNKKWLRLCIALICIAIRTALRNHERHRHAHAFEQQDLVAHRSHGRAKLRRGGTRQTGHAILDLECLCIIAQLVSCPVNAGLVWSKGFATSDTPGGGCGHSLAELSCSKREPRDQ